MKILSLLITLLLSTAMLFSQEESTSSADTLRKDALNVYYPSASSHLKKEISYINYVRDRKVADLVIISTSQGTGSGGDEYTYFFEGQGDYKNMFDTIKFASNVDDTYETTREVRIKTIKMGLIRYIQKTPLRQYIDIRFTEPLSEEVTTDKWNSWVFSAGLNGMAFASQSNDFYSISANSSASRVTEDWKIRINGRYSVDIRELRWTDPTTFEDMVETNRKKSSSINTLIVKSLGEHWSVGFTSGISGSIYSNYVSHFTFQPGIEYNIFPFSESTKKQFRFMYTIGPVYNNYCDTTDYFKKNEVVGQQSIMAAYMNIQKWGNFDASVSWNNYLHDLDLNRLSISSSISVRVAKGLRVNLSGGYSFIHDQINLRKGTASASDVMMSRQEMATTYSYDVFFGFSYTFGSIYNNAVNPRFGRSGGSRIIMF